MAPTLREKLIVLQLIKNFPSFHENRRLTNAITIARLLSLLLEDAFSILLFHLRLDLPSGSFHKVFPLKHCTPLSSPPTSATYLAHQFFFDLITRIIFGHYVIIIIIIIIIIMPLVTGLFFLVLLLNQR